MDLQITEMQNFTQNSELLEKEVGCERKCKLSVTESNLLSALHENTNIVGVFFNNYEGNFH